MLLEDQDRSRWDQALIRQAIDCLRRSAQGDAVSHYHLEAGIAMYHCKAQSFAETDWKSGRREAGATDILSLAGISAPIT